MHNNGTDASRETNQFSQSVGYNYSAKLKLQIYHTFLAIFCKIFILVKN